MIKADAYAFELAREFTLAAINNGCLETFCSVNTKPNDLGKAISAIFLNTVEGISSTIGGAE